MTIVAAVQDGADIWIGCDTGTTFRETLHDNGAKWVLAPDRKSAVGQSGDALILQIMQREAKRLAWGKDPFDMGRSIERVLEGHGIKPYFENKDVSGNYGQSWIYAWPGGVYYIACDFSFLGPETHAAVGSGWPFALGAAHKAAGKPEEILGRMLSAAMALNVGCGKGAMIERIKTSALKSRTTIGYASRPAPKGRRRRIK